MRIFNIGRFFMPKNPLLDEIETPDGVTDAYCEIESLLDQQAEGVWDSSRSSAMLYYEVKVKLNELMEVLKS